MTQSDYLLISRGQWDETASPQDVQDACRKANIQLL